MAVLLIAAKAQAATIDFEQFNDSDLLTTQITGLTFANTIILTAGISLNEIDFPPHSGQNVAGDNGGPIAISFAQPIASFSGYFTYTTNLALDGLDASSNVLAVADSKYSANFTSSGVPGATPDELLQISSAKGFSQIVITGNPAGGSFVVDDITFTPLANATTPEPAAVSLATAGFAVLALYRLSFSRRR